MNLEELFECCACLFTFKKWNKFEDTHGKLAGTLKSHLNVVHVDLLSKNEKKFEDTHGKLAGTLNSHLTVAHVEPGHLVEPAQAAMIITTMKMMMMMMMMMMKVMMMMMMIFSIQSCFVRAGGLLDLVYLARTRPCLCISMGESWFPHFSSHFYKLINIWSEMMRVNKCN